MKGKKKKKSNPREKPYSQCLKIKPVARSPCGCKWQDKLKKYLIGSHANKKS